MQNIDKIPFVKCPVLVIHVSFQVPNPNTATQHRVVKLRTNSLSYVFSQVTSDSKNFCFNLSLATVACHENFLNEFWRGAVHYVHYVELNGLI